MTIKDDLYFVYDGKSSDDLGIANVSIEEVWVDEPFLSTVDINSLQIKGRDKPYLMNVERSPLQFNLTFAFLDNWDEDLIQEVANLFHTDYYKPLYFSNNEDCIYYCMYTGDPRLLHYNLKRGYINMEFICNDICAYSRLKQIEYNNLQMNGHQLSFINRGGLEIYPEMIIKCGANTISIQNENTNQTLVMNGLAINEEIYIDNDNETINTNHPTILYRYINHNDVFLKMSVGRNKLLLNGITDIKFQWRFKLLQS